MSHLKIVDLNFCESQTPSNSELQGGVGITISSPTGSWSASANWANGAGYFTDFFFDKSTGNFGYVIGAGVAGAVAGAAAGALSDGSHYASAYSSAGVI